MFTKTGFFQSKYRNYLKFFKNCSLAAFVFLYFFSGINYALAKPQISAPSAILIDAASGQVLWTKNPDEKRAIASTTKIMTAILVIENVPLSDSVVTSKKASNAGESEIYLSEGEKLTVEQLLYGLMLKSANDAALALAEKTGGSVENFVAMMNGKAKKLKMDNTRFANPHGLSNGSHFSTARDMSTIAHYAMKNNNFRKIVGTKKVTIPWPGNQYQRVLENFNKLLGYYDKATGIKTGYISKSGYCLVSSAKDGNHEVIAVVLGARSSQESTEQSKMLLEWGLNNFKHKAIVKKGRAYANLKISEREEIPLVAESSKTMLVSEEAGYRTFVVADKTIKPPITKGQQMGRLEIMNENGENIGNVPLIAKKDSRTSFLNKGLDILKNIVDKIKITIR